MMTSEKCDFKFSVDEPGLTPLIFTGVVGVDQYEWNNIAPNARVGVQSSKCEWSVSSNVSRFKSFVSSSKCDFNVIAANDRFESKMSSAKCDFNISAINRSPKPSIFNSETVGTKMAVASAKCDWKINTVGGNATLTQRPALNANLESSKCDFVYNIHIGFAGKESQINLRAISSSKCDFRIEKLDGPIQPM